MSLWAEILVWILVGSGAFFTIVGAWGVVRLPDLYTRMHAASVTDTLATFLILAGCAVPVLLAGDWLIAIKLFFILVFLWFTSPMASYALAHAAFFDGDKPVLDHDLTEDREGSA
ncbi:monovalent cation/H(+) antiporter subunit G [Minwuia thermotolerans]|uniref:Sodium:proton antiporter n=1 Tax=Minwuia thermotolerans TaxID=2056226 RepID=A0A2M9FZ23_9PROT|nr:monovalent cation/H(+) antiporter subunit G [Minwuia thermotolerans]PJK28705.1 sodium:proton antiporter [Minwuia thermotolerans]